MANLVVMQKFNLKIWHVQEKVWEPLPKSVHIKIPKTTHTNANIQPNLYDIDNFENYQFPTFSRYTISCEVNAWGLPLNRRHAIVWTNDGFTFHTFIYVTRPPWVNPLAPGRFEWKFRQVIFKLISVINGWGIFCEMIRRRIWLDLTDDKLTLIQVINWANVDQVLCRHIASLGLHNLMLGSVRCRIMASHKHAWLWSLTDCCQEVFEGLQIGPAVVRLITTHNIWGPFQRRFVHRYSNSMKIGFRVTSL